MHLYKRGNVYWVEYETGGKRYRQSCKTGRRDVALTFMNSIKTAAKMPTFEDAVEVLRRLYNKPDPGVVNLASTWATYLQVARSVGRDKISSDTMRRREGTIKNLVAWLKKNRPLVNTVEAVTQPVAAAYAAALAEGGRKTKTRANIIGELSSVWRMLEKASTGIHNPWRSLMPQDTDSEVGKAFTPDELRRVLEAAAKVGKDWRPVCMIALHTGLRYGDVATMRWAQIEKNGDAFANGVIRLKPSKTARHGIQTAFPITAPLAEALSEVDGRGGDFLFPMHSELHGNRGRMSREALSFAEVLKAAGLYGQGFTFHSLRHTAATRLAGAGVDIETRKRILGHTVDATARRYDHDEHLAEVKAAMERAATSTSHNIFSIPSPMPELSSPPSR